MASRIMRWPAVLWLVILAALFIFLLAVEAPWWTLLIWIAVAAVLGPRSLTAALSGYVVDEGGIPIEKSAREGVVGHTARWTAKAYGIASKTKCRTATDFVNAVIWFRYFEADPHPLGEQRAVSIRSALITLTEHDDIHGLAHLVFLILAAENGILPDDQKGRIPLIRVIVEELELAAVDAAHIVGERNVDLLLDPAALDAKFWPAASVLQG